MDKASEKSFPALICVAFWIFTLTGVSEFPKDPFPNGLWIENQLDPRIPELPPKPHENTYPLSVKAKVCL